MKLNYKKMNKDLGFIKSSSKTGEERLSVGELKLDYRLIDFWRWSASDVLSNATRGRFAEFIVGTVIDLDFGEVRDEWGAYDLVTKSGIKIEVKSSAYIQSWNQKKYSQISFSIKPAKFWSPETAVLENESKRHADLYIFCLLNHKDQSTIDPMKLEQWEFFVLPTSVLNNYERSESSITLNSLKKLTKSIEYMDLKQELSGFLDNKL